MNVIRFNQWPVGKTHKDGKVLERVCPKCRRRGLWTISSAGVSVWHVQFSNRMDVCHLPDDVAEKALTEAQVAELSELNEKWEAEQKAKQKAKEAAK